MRCLTSGRFSMVATVLRQGAQVTVAAPDQVAGQYVDEQDPISGDIIRVWQPAVTDDPTTPDNEIEQTTIPCTARGMVGGGVKASGTTEQFGSEYEAVDFVRMWFPPNYTLSRRDRISAIRDKAGRVHWVEEEINTQNNEYVATVFNVNGVTPLFDAFDQHIENMALLERAEFNG